MQDCCWSLTREIGRASKSRREYCGWLGAGQTQADEKKSVENPKVLLFLGTGRPTVPLVRITVVDQFPIRALYVQVGDRAADKIIFSMN